MMFNVQILSLLLVERNLFSKYRTSAKSLRKISIPSWSCLDGVQEANNVRVIRKELVPWEQTSMTMITMTITTITINRIKMYNHNDQQHDHDRHNHHHDQDLQCTWSNGLETEEEEVPDHVLVVVVQPATVVGHHDGDGDDKQAREGDIYHAKMVEVMMMMVMKMMTMEMMMTDLSRQATTWVTSSSSSAYSSRETKALMVTTLMMTTTAIMMT